jgi:hypothetical protein
MAKPKILLQLDSDPQPSVFDSVVAIDAGADHLLRHGNLMPDDVRNLVYGCIFTRGPEDLVHTALFVGGSDVAAGEKLLKAVTKTFFGPFRCSVMLDANGANTTAAAAVLALEKHLPLSGCEVLVLAATGPVGQRAARLLARAGAKVRVGSRSLSRSEAVCENIAQRVPNAQLTPVETSEPSQLQAALAGTAGVIAAGAAGIELLPQAVWSQAKGLKVAIDLNAVPPVGIGGIEPPDRAKERPGVVCYGAIGVGGSKMKIHKAALRSLFERNDLVLDAEEIFDLGRTLS